MTEIHDILVVGGGAAGATLGGRLAAMGRDVAVIEAGPGDRHPLVAMPFGLVWLIGSRRDWRYRSAPQAALGGRRIKVPRGRVLGGSASINSMVWFRGRADDYAAWGPGWGWDAVRPAFEAVEAEMRPVPLPHPHPLSRALGEVHGGPPDPERVSSGPFVTNMERGRRRSPVRAFLDGSGARVVTGAEVEDLVIADGRACGVRLVDGREIRARAGVVLCAGAIGSPTLLLRAGLGGAGVGANLHDHPGVAVHHEGAGSGYGLTLGQLPRWSLAPFDWALRGRGPFASNTVEAGAFLPLEPGGPPRVQVHFLPCRVGHGARAIGWGAGYFADVCVMQPRSRGRLTLGEDRQPLIDLGLLQDRADRDTLRAGLRAMRLLLAEAPFGARRAPEVVPGPGCISDAELDAHIEARAATAYHPVGTCALHDVTDARLAVKGVAGLWVADASVMPRITSANTSAPSIMIGYRGADFIQEDLR